MTAKMSPATLATLVFFVRDWLFEGPYGECGERPTSSSFSVVAEAPDGRRWVSPEVGRGGFFYDEDGFPRPNRQAEDRARVKAERLAARLTRGNRTEVLAWTPDAPCYGSAAWGPENEAALAALDR